MSEVEDELAVRNLIARFAEATDLGSIEDYMSCIGDGCVLVMSGGLMARTGVAEIRAAVEDNRSAGQFGPGSDTMHLLGPSRVSVDGQTATASTPFQFFRDTAGTKELVALGRYLDTFARSSGDWRLVRRQTQLG